MSIIGNCNYTLVQLVVYEVDKNDKYTSTLVVLSVIWTVIALLNFGSVLIFASEKTLRKRHHIFLGSLAVSECIYVVTAIISILYRDPEPSIRQALYSIICASHVVSFETVLAIAIERLLVIVIFPFKKDLNSPKKLFTTCAVLWILSYTTVGMVFISADNMLFEFEFIIAIYNIAVVVLVSATYCVIYISVCRHETQMDIVPQELRLSKRLLKTFAIVVGVFAISWLPIEIVGILDYSFKFRCENIIIVDIYITCFILSLTHSLATPIVYGWRIEDFRKAVFKRIFRKSEQ